jgi:hypothetical protein
MREGISSQVNVDKPKLLLHARADLTNRFPPAEMMGRVRREETTLAGRAGAGRDTDPSGGRIGATTVPAAPTRASM